MFRTCLDTNGNSFGLFRIIEIFHFSHLFFSRPPSVHWAKFLPEKDLETCWKHVWLLLGTIFGHFGKLKVLPVFLKFFQVSTLQGALRKNFSRKDYREACSKRVWTFLIMFVGILKKKWKFFHFFEIFPSLDLPGCTEHFFPRKLPQNKFGHFWKRFLSGLWNFEIFSIFVDFFESPVCFGHSFFPSK